MSQGSLCWQAKFGDPTLARHFRLTDFDMRGHGNSAIPHSRTAYASDELYAADIASVLTALNLRKRRTCRCRKAWAQ